MSSCHTTSESHTPGPWVAVNYGFKKSGFWIRKASDTIGRGNVAVVPRSTIKPFEANARLITAAPDLLAALKLVVDTYGFDSSTDSAIWQTACAAIAKAEGRNKSDEEVAK